MHGSADKPPMGPRVLVVDDEELVRASLRRTLRRVRLEVETTGSPAEALEWLRTSRYHAVVCDLSMPEMDGITLLAEASRVAPLTSRVIVSGYLDGQELVRAINTEVVFQVVPKPFEPDELTAVVHRAVNRTELLWANAERLAAADRAQRQLGQALRTAERQVEVAAREAIALLSRALRPWPSYDPRGADRAESVLEHIPELVEQDPQTQERILQVVRLAGALSQDQVRLVEVLQQHGTLAAHAQLLADALEPSNASRFEARLVRLALELSRARAQPGFDPERDWPVVSATARTKVGLDGDALGHVAG